MVEKRRLACRVLEIVVLSTIIITIWIAMFLPVAVYFLPLDSAQPSNATMTKPALKSFDSNQHQQSWTTAETVPPSTEQTFDSNEHNMTTTEMSTEQPLFDNDQENLTSIVHMSNEHSIDANERDSRRTQMSSCQNLLDNVSTSESVRVCREDFFPDPVSGHCKPRCSSWLMFDQPTEIASLAVIGISTVVGILTTVVIITVSCIHFKSMLEFPSVLIIYQDVIMSVHGIFVLIGFMDRRLFCSSEDLTESYQNPASPFCTISGVVSSYVVYPLTLWISIQVGYTLLAVCTPLYFKHLNKKRKKRWCIHIASLLAGFVAILVPTMLSLFLGGYSSVDTRFPPIVCWTKDRDLTVYTFLIPMGVMLSVIDTELILILHYLIRNRCLNKNSSKELKQAEIKVLVICCCYVLLGMATLLGYSMSSATLGKLQHELLDYFECERCGVNSGQMCERSGFERLTNPPLITVAYSLLALYPVITLVYVLRIKRQPRSKQVLPDVTSSL